MFLPLEMEPAKDWDLALGSGGNAEAVGADRDDDRRCRLLFTAIAAAFAAMAAFGVILDVVSAVFNSTSDSTLGAILMQKK
jgi:hypothetical protein